MARLRESRTVRLSSRERGWLCWTELHTPAPAAARAFYDHLFRWRVQELDMPRGMTYTTLGTGGAQGGFGGLMPTSPGEQPAWLIWFETADCDAAAEATALGGTVLHQPETMNGVGRMATLIDPRGAPFSVITSEREPQN